MKPTVGRIVHFYDFDCDCEAVPMAAIVTAVWTDECINVAVFRPDGTTSSHTSIVRRHASGLAGWDWPPRI